MKTESDREWSRYAWKQIRWGLFTLLGFVSCIAMGISSCASGSPWQGAFQIAIGLLWLIHACWRLDNAWPWITHKIDEIID